MDTILLIILSFFTSAFNAAVGIGGGVLLVAIMTTFLPPAAVVPIHGIVQLASNASRNLFNIRHTEWSILPSFTLGVVAGAFLGSRAVIAFPVQYLPILLGLFILFITWAPDVINRIFFRGNFIVLGLLQGSLTLLLGATGPLNIPFLLNKNISRDSIIATNGLLMTITHSIKIATFGLIGFQFGPYAFLVLMMIIAVTAGSYAGSRFRNRLPEQLSIRLFRIIITLLSFSMIIKAVFI